MEKTRSPIYIVDDDASFCKSLSRLLNAGGFSTECFLSAQSFLEIIALRPQKGIAVVDVDMPECDGFCLMDTMKKQGYDIPVILITGRAKADTQSNAVKYGAIGFLLKPFAEQALIEMIELQTKGTKRKS